MEVTLLHVHLEKVIDLVGSRRLIPSSLFPFHVLLGLRFISHCTGWVSGTGEKEPLSQRVKVAPRGGASHCGIMRATHSR